MRSSGRGVIGEGIVQGAAALGKPPFRPHLVAVTLRAVFFDAVGTLIHLARPVGESYREIAARHGADLEAGALDRAFRAAFSRAPKRTSANGPRPDDDKGWWRALVSGILAGALPSDQRAGFDEEAYFENLYAHFAAPGVWVAYPEAPETLRELKARGLALGVISNFDRRLYPVLDSLGLTGFFNAIIISSEVGVEKPDPVIFHRALDRLQIPAAEALHVGDEPADWAAASVGMQVFKLERPGTTLRDAAAAAY